MHPRCHAGVLLGRVPSHVLPHNASTRSLTRADRAPPAARVGPGSFIPLGDGAALVAFPLGLARNDDGVFGAVPGYVTQGDGRKCPFRRSGTRVGRVVGPPDPGRCAAAVGAKDAGRWMERKDPDASIRVWFA